MSVRVMTYLLSLFFMCGCYNHTEAPHIESSLPIATTTMEHLKAAIVGSGAATIQHDIVVVGRVTSSDSNNNFFRELTVEDSTGAIEVMVGLDNLHTIYPEGLLVALQLKGCHAAYRYGVLQVGSKAESYDTYDVDYLKSRVEVDNVVVRSTDVDRLQPQHRTIASLRKELCGTLAHIDNLQLVASTSIDTLQHETLADATWQGYATFVDECHDTLVVYTRPYATYASQHIPLEKVSICGIVQYGKSHNSHDYYQLKMRYAEDCTIY